MLIHQLASKPQTVMEADTYDGSGTIYSLANGVTTETDNFWFLYNGDTVGGTNIGMVSGIIGTFDAGETCETFANNQVTGAPSYYNEIDVSTPFESGYLVFNDLTDLTLELDTTAIFAAL
jgi:hypothetical protein